ncbi:MAG: hypothetical protein M3Q13_08085 [Pseudomonadota bacterium]|nr:hypothetical protein [Pseudomonadota bacterium]
MGAGSCTTGSWAAEASGCAALRSQAALNAMTIAAASSYSLEVVRGVCMTCPYLK